METGTPEEPAASPAVPVAKPLYTPGGGAEFSGHFYQGGEPIPQRELEKLTPQNRRGLEKRGAHSDPALATHDLFEHPVQTFEENEAGKKIPAYGKRERTPYEDEPPPALGKANGPHVGSHHVPPSLLSWVGPQEAVRATRLQAKRLVRLLADMPPTFEYAEAARLGASQRKWYQSAQKAFSILFGEEAPRFAALFAATSPRTGVSENFIKSLEIWDRYMQLRGNLGGRLPSREQLAALLPEWAGEAPVLNKVRSGYTKAALTALTSEDPESENFEFFGQPQKINSFRLNLMEDYDRVTNDVWIAALSGTDPEILKRVGPYLAHSVKLRQAAKRLNTELRPGEEEWTPAEVQAACWSTIRALAYVGGKSRVHSPRRGLTPLEAFAELTHETIKESTNLIKLLAKDENTRAVLKRIGLGKAINKVLQSHEKDFGKSAEAYRGPVVSGTQGDAQRIAHESIARKGGAKVGSFAIPKAIRQFAKQGAPVTAAPPMSAPAAAPQQSPVANPQPAAQPTPQPQAQIAVSPQTEAGLSFEDALQKYRSANQAAFRKLTDHIRKSLGLEGTSHDAVGDWQSEAENSVLQQIKPESAHPDKVKYAAAWYGLLGNQKAVLYFLPGRNGQDSVYQAEIPQTDVAQVRQALDKAGVKDRTIIPTGKGVKVVFFDEGRRLRDQFLQFAGGYPNARVSETTGAGSFIGAATRSAARHKYRSIIAAYERTHGRPAGTPGGPPAAPAAAGGGANPAAGQAARLHRRGVSVTGRQKGRKRKLAQISREATLKAVDEAIFRGMWHDGGAREFLQEGNMRAAIKGWLQGQRHARLPNQVGYPVDQFYLNNLYRQVVDLYPNISRELLIARLKHMYRQPGGYDYLFTAKEAKKQLRLMKLENSPDWIDTRNMLVTMMESPKTSPTVQRLAHVILTGDYGVLPILADALEEDNRPEVANRLRRMTPYHEMQAEKAYQFPVRPPFTPRPDPADADVQLFGSLAPRMAQETEQAPVTKPQQPAPPPKLTPGEQRRHEQYVLSDEYKHSRLKAPRPVKRMAALRSPAQGIVVRGVYYKGGKFIPSAELEKATYEQHQQVERSREQMYRRPDGSYDLSADLAARRKGRKKKYARQEELTRPCAAKE